MFSLRSFLTILFLITLGFFFPWANTLGSLLGVAVSLVLTLFLGIGSILVGNAGNMPNQKLPLRTDGCYLNETISLNEFSFDSSQLLRENTAWKDVEYDGLTTLLSMSYLWQPLITVVSNVIFGILFSAIVNMMRKSPPTPVKQRYFTPLILSMWVAILGKDRLTKWVEFEDEDCNANELKKENFGMGSIPRASLSSRKSKFSYDNDAVAPEPDNISPTTTLRGRNTMYNTFEDPTTTNH